MSKKKYYYKNNNYHNNHKKNKQRQNNNMNNYDKESIENIVNNKIEENLNIDNEIIENDFEVVLKKKEVPVEPIVNQETLSNSQIDEEINNSIKNNTIINYNEEETEKVQEEVIKKPKKNFLIKTRFGYVLGVIILLLLLLGTTYSYFNYTSETSEADIASGDMYVKVVENTVNLSNKLYPMTKEDARSKQDNVVTFNVKGLNTSDKTIYYEVKLNYGESKNSPYIRFNDKDLVFDLVEVNGNNETYVVNARSYSDIANGARIWVDTIDPNTTTEVTKTYKLRMWLSDTVTIDDDGGTYPASTYRNYYASIKASVYGDLIEKELSDAYTKFIKKDATLDTTIDFSKISPISASNLNGQGKQILKGTENDSYPIIYYRGEVNNNNVVFADFCWQIVRTTDTGGIKMIYNGLATKTGDEYSCNGTAATKGINGSDGTWSISLNSASVFGKTFSYDLNAGTFTLEDIVQENNVNVNWSTTNIDKLIGTYTCNSSSTTCSTIYYVGYYTSNTGECLVSFTIGNLEHYSIIGKSSFNTYNNLMATTGYAYNEMYKDNNNTATSGAYFATEIEYDDVNNVYNLKAGTTSTTKDDNHHYTCNLTTANGTCSSIRYYYYNDNNNDRYITLTEGETVEDAIYKMTGNGSSETKQKNAEYELNKIDSAAKQMLEIWYKNNLTNEVDNSKFNYTNYLEDTIYCNDRGVENTIASSGWKSNGGDLTGELYFDGFYRAQNMSTVNVPKMTCSNETDSFSVSNNKARLKYPVGLLTSDEIILAGGKRNANNTTYYLKNNLTYWSMSPNSFRGISSTYNLNITSEGRLIGNYVDRSGGLRPVVSLKLGTEFIDGGDGTTTNPYVVKMD